MSPACHTCTADDMDQAVWVFTLVTSIRCFVDCSALPLDTQPTQSLPKHGSGQGFRYEVRYPPAPRTTPRQDGGGAPEAPKFQQYSDVMNTHPEERSSDPITELPSEVDQIISCGEGELNEGYGDSENYEGYQYLQPSNKLTEPQNLRGGDFIYSTSKRNRITDPLDSVPEASNVQEVPWMGDFSSNTLTSDTLNLQNSPSPNSSKDHLVPVDQDSSAPETYSSVRFTGSFFTEEGLPVLGNNTELPVDYRFEYLIRGVPDLGHEESRVDHTARGRYWVLLPDGRVQEVSYVADSQGYRPTNTYRQPGQQPVVELS